ncbi:MAG: hypothetical protein R3C26_11160 [Calditrichia bacterium]
MNQESVRQRKAADKIKEIVSIIIDREIKDPDKGFVTVITCRNARFYDWHPYILPHLAMMKPGKNHYPLNRAKSFIRNEMAPLLKMRFVPDLRFCR